MSGKHVACTARLITAEHVICKAPPSRENLNNERVYLYLMGMLVYMAPIPWKSIFLSHNQT